MPKPIEFNMKAILCPHLEGVDPDEAWAIPMVQSIRLEDTQTHATDMILCPACYGVITGHVLRDVFSDSMKAIAEKVARETLSNVQVNGMYKARRGG